MSLERLELGARLARVRRVLGDARDLRGERVRVAQKLLRLLALDLVALVALNLLLLHLLLVRHHGVRTESILFAHLACATRRFARSLRRVVCGCCARTDHWYGRAALQRFTPVCEVC